MAKTPEHVVSNIYHLSYIEGLSSTEISKSLNIPARTIRGILCNVRHQLANQHLVSQSPETESLKAVVKLQKKVQGLQDSNRIERKAFREFARTENLVLEMQDKLTKTLEKNRFTKTTYPRLVPARGKDWVQPPIGVVQFSDVHFNELINDLDGNKYDFGVASQRIRKHIQKAKRHFQACNVQDVAVFCTGDMLNSDRRLDEITNAAENRSKAIFLAVDILQQAIHELAENFNVTVSSITGNESRVGEFVHWSSFLAGDSYDLVIHNMLAYLFKDIERVNFIPVTNPLEQVVSLNGVNFLLVHGHGHKGLAATTNIEREVVAIKAKYASRGVKIDYVLAGHIHSSYVSDNFSRSSGMPGNNAYSERALNLNGKAAQNLFVVYPNGDIDGIKVDLQNVEGIEGYPFDTTLAAYNSKSGKVRNTVTIQSVLI